MVGSLWKGADVNVIETHGLTKRYRRKLAVDNLDMTVAAATSMVSWARMALASPPR